MEETLDRLTYANSVQWYEHVLRRHNGDVLRTPLYFKGRNKRRWVTKDDVEKAGGRIH